MATINSSSIQVKSPAKVAGLFFAVILLSACQTGKPPEEVARLFWNALAQGQLEQAKSYTTRQSKHLVGLDDIDKLSPVTTGEAVEDENNDSRVPTTIVRHQQRVAFETVLQREDDTWKIDYLRTQLNITIVPLGDMAKSLTEMGGAFAKELEQQLPRIQKEVESLGMELKKHLDEFSRSLKIPPKQGNPPSQGKSI